MKGKKRVRVTTTTKDCPICGLYKGANICIGHIHKGSTVSAFSVCSVCARKDLVITTGKDDCELKKIDRILPSSISRCFGKVSNIEVKKTRRLILQ